ncbi:MAG: hypothetical protein EZS28_035881 [Streblomastix strix]|uniref:DH domain-containing protein n=1 Tax=Streblomastix strix TaxID=222440 RepID=A0A5J4UFI5_9EUKA|nr:MAG: hypothetical protein EZS28_035881 [Streblomastix strix]
MEQILKFHKLFSYELQCVCYNWTVHSRVGQTFCKQAPFMKISVEYFQKKEQASKLLRELLKSDPKFNQIVEDISQQEEVNHEPLEQLLNRPVKRISEYNLLLQKMNESMFDWQPDSKHVHLASKMMEEIASFFNFCIHRTAWLIENQKELERKQQEEDEEQMKIINDTKLVLKMDEKQKQLYLMNAIEGRFLFLLFTPTNTYLFDAMNSDARRRFITKLEGYVRKQVETNDKKVEG